MKYTLKRTKRKSLAISIVDGEVIVRAPLFMNEMIIKRFVQEKQEWIQSKVAAYRPKGLDLLSGKMRLYGNDVFITVHDHEAFKFVNEGNVLVFKPQSWGMARTVKEIEAVLRQDLNLYIDQRLDHYSKLLGIKKPPYIIRRYKRIYGRCNNRNELAFNLYLYHEHHDFIDYVILHECAHIIEFNHSQSFYNIIEKHMPHYKEVIRLSKV